jgi:putative ABC transport system ATP-binding protein
LGKSTLLNVMGTLDRPTHGTVEIVGHDITAVSGRQLSALRGRWLGFVFQQFHLADGLSAAENVTLGLLYAGGEPTASAGHEALGRVGLARRVGHLPHQLYGGERQRVAIARALVNEPSLVLAPSPPEPWTPPFRRFRCTPNRSHQSPGPSPPWSGNAEGAQ